MVCCQANQQSNFRLRNDIDVISSYKSIALIGSFSNTNKMQCLAACTNDCNCFVAIFQNKICTLYNKRATNYLILNNENVGDVFIRK